MLKDILSISGRPGLFKLLSTTKTNFVVESLADNRRLPISAQERVVSLKEISVYSENGDIPLGEVFEEIFKKEGGKEINLGQLGNDKQQLFDYFTEVLPTFDKSLVHANEIKKMLGWYNLLVAHGFDKFVDKKEDESSEDETEGNRMSTDSES